MPRIALVHDWLTGMRGGEKVLEILCELYPEATVFTLVHNRGSVSPVIESMPIRTSFIQGFPMSGKRYRRYLPFFPSAVEKLDLRGFDLVISSSHCVAKGAIPGPGAVHICYCHTPMRYVWSMYDEYFGGGRAGPVASRLLPYIANYLRLWDSSSAHRVDTFIANSSHVKKRIERYYGRDAAVIHPPVQTEGTYLSGEDDGYYLVVSAFAPYKRVDIALEAFRILGRRLVVVGTGQDERRLRRLAGPGVEMAGWVDTEGLRGYYARCRALVFPGEEDFGIVPVEAQCYGKPVIALGRGGALETVRGIWADEQGKGDAKGASGVFFREQSASALAGAVERFEQLAFDHRAIRERALSFDREVFRDRIRLFVEEELSRR